MLNIKIPQNITNICIDVGTSCNAPFSAEILKKQKNTIIFGFEPNPQNVESLHTGHGKAIEKWILNPRICLSENAIYDNNIKVCSLSDNNNIFEIFEYAIDDVQEETFKNFYCTSEENTGCSSLKKPIENILKVSIKNKINVKVIPLFYLLQQIDWKKYNYIDVLKTDTQSNDLNVIKSCKDYIKNIKYIQSEYHTGGQYEDEDSREQSFNNFEEYMKKYDFNLLNRDSHDIIYINKRFNNE
jgi:hypothetical protein